MSQQLHTCTVSAVWKHFYLRCAHPPHLHTRTHTQAYGDNWKGIFEAITGYGLGGSSIALFGRVGGGIYTKVRRRVILCVGGVRESRVCCAGSQLVSCCLRAGCRVLACVSAWAAYVCWQSGCLHNFCVCLT